MWKEEEIEKFEHSLSPYKSLNPFFYQFGKHLMKPLIAIYLRNFAETCLKLVGVFPIFTSLRGCNVIGLIFPFQELPARWYKRIFAFFE